MRTTAKARAKPAPKTGATATASRARPTRAADAEVVEPIRLFQYFNQPEQRPFLDPGFEALLDIGNHGPLSALALRTRMAERADLQSATLWGALSWQFGEGTGLTASGLRQQIASNAGQDAYYIYPQPQFEALYANVWQQGTSMHPHFVALAGAFFKAAGLPWAQLQNLQPPRQFASAEFLVATPAFWNAYLGWLDNTLALAKSKLPPAAWDMLNASASEAGSATQPGEDQTPIRYIADRLLSVYLHTEQGQNFKACKLVCDTDPGATDIHLRMLADMKSVACRTRSKWLITCWANYRDLYCVEKYGAAWTRRNMKAASTSSTASTTAAPTPTASSTVPPAAATPSTFNGTAVVEPA